MKYQREFEEYFKKKTFSTRDVKLFLQSKKAPQTYASLFLANNIKKNRIFRLTRGRYSFSSNLDAIEKAFYPAYHGLQDALSIHSIWQQQTIPVLITPRKVRPGERETLGAKLFLHRINRKMFFGYEEKKYFGSWVTVSDLEKTLIDFAYYREPLDKSALAKMKRTINKNKLKEYLKKTNKQTKEKVLGLMG